MLTDESGVYLPEDLRVGDSIDVWGREAFAFAFESGSRGGPLRL